MSEQDRRQLEELRRKYGKREGLRAFREAEYGRIFAEALVPQEQETVERTRRALHEHIPGRPQDCWCWTGARRPSVRDLIPSPTGRAESERDPGSTRRVASAGHTPGPGVSALSSTAGGRRTPTT